MQQYKEILKEILELGSLGEPARDNMPRTKFVIDREIRIKDGKLPILMGKKVLFDKVISELIWFLKGDTNIEFLHKYNNHIWDQDAYRYYQKLGGRLEYDEWLSLIGKKLIKCTLSMLPDNYVCGDCGRIYGYQWRRQGFDNKEYVDYELKPQSREHVDQIKNLIYGLISTPFSRYHIVDAWNAQDMIEGHQALPACHTGFMCAVRDIAGTKYLDLSVTQRSCDMFLGVPYNLLSYGILHHILCKLTDYKLGEFVWHGFNCHIYDNQVEAVKEYLSRDIPENNVELLIDDSIWGFDKDVDNIEVEHFKLLNYEPHSFIKAPLSTGLKQN